MADYNLGEKKNCLIGNWMEEHALQDYTGHFRVPPKDDQGSHTRCIEHTVRLEPKSQITSNRRDFNHPADPTNPLDYKPAAFVGAREKLMMERLKAAVSQPAPPPPPQRYFESTMAADFTVPDPAAQEGGSIGARRMRTRDMQPVETRDKLWLLEHNAAPKHICTATREGIEADSALIEQDVPITVYSAQPAIFPMSNPTQGANPFSKNSLFTQPIEHYNRGPVKDL